MTNQYIEWDTEIEELFSRYYDEADEYENEEQETKQEKQTKKD